MTTVRFPVLVELVESVQDSIDASAGAVLELEDAQLDHVVCSEVGPSDLGVHDQADECWLIRLLRAVCKRLETAQHAVNASGVEHVGDAVERLAHAVSIPTRLRMADGTVAAPSLPQS